MTCIEKMIARIAICRVNKNGLARIGFFATQEAMWRLKEIKRSPITKKRGRGYAVEYRRSYHHRLTHQVTNCLQVQWIWRRLKMDPMRETNQKSDIENESFTPRPSGALESELASLGDQHQLVELSSATTEGVSHQNVSSALDSQDWRGKAARGPRKPTINTCRDSKDVTCHYPATFSRNSRKAFNASPKAMFWPNLIRRHSIFLRDSPSAWNSYLQTQSDSLVGNGLISYDGARFAFVANILCIGV